MRYFLLLWILGAGLCMPSMAMAEDAAKTKQAEPSQDKVKEDAPAKDENPAARKEFDAEEYFKRGEDNLYSGSNCAPPPEIIT